MFVLKPTRPPLTTPSAQFGFSLIELMVVIAILAVITVLAAPSINHALERQRNKELAQSIANALKEARVESVLRHQDVKVDYQDALGIVVRSTSKNIDGTAKPDDKNIIRNYPVNKAGLVEVDPLVVTFTASKKVNLTASGGINQPFINYQTYCNASKKVGRVVRLTSQGVISIITENSQC